MPLIFQSTAVARPAYYDRNPITTMVSINLAVVAPHVLTLRASYTVPANKKAWLDSVWLHIVRSNAAAPAGPAEIRCNETTTVVGAQLATYVYHNNNTVGFDVTQNLANGGFLGTGDNIQVFTIDTSTGGSCDYDMAVKATQFDA